MSNLPALRPRPNGRDAGIAGPLLAASAATMGAAAVYNAWRADRAEAAHPPIGRFIEVDGVRLHVVEAGRGGPPALLLHGNGAMIEDMILSGVFSRIAAHRRVVAIDRPGFGYSDRPRTTIWTPLEQARLIRAALDRLGVERAVVLGHSWGAIAALALGIVTPERVRGLVLASGYYFPTMRMDVALFTPPALPVIGDVLRYTVSPLLGRLLAPKMLRKIFAPRPVPERFRRGFPLDLALRPSQLRASSADTALMVPGVAAMEGGYRGMRVPAIIVAGAADEVVTTARQSVRLAHTLPDADLHVLPGLGHMIHYDAAAADLLADAVERLAHARPAFPPAPARSLA